MSDLSDPTALREAAWQDTIAHFGTDASEEMMGHLKRYFGWGFDAAAAHFAAELDGLRAQIEEARAHVAKIDIIMYETGSASVGKLEDILAQSPRGTVARIQAGAWAEGYSHCFECPEPGTSLDDNPYTNPFASSGDTTNGEK